MTDGRSRRPAEVQLVTQLADERDALLEGFDSRRDVLRWGQRLAVRTLGQIPDHYYRQLANSYQPDGDALEGPLLAAFLTDAARTRDLEDDVAAEIRGDWAAEVIAPTQTRAFRDLRKDAGEYVGNSDEDDQDDPGYQPDDQTFAMRPALEELDDYQERALETALGGLKDKGQILVWGDLVTQATRGEPVDPELGAGEFIARCYRQPSTVSILTKTDDAHRRAREAFLARWLWPAFNRGVRDLSGRTAEEPREQAREQREERQI